MYTFIPGTYPVPLFPFAPSAPVSFPAHSNQHHLERTADKENHRPNFRTPKRRQQNSNSKKNMTSLQYQRPNIVPFNLPQKPVFVPHTHHQHFGHPAPSRPRPLALEINLNYPNAAFCSFETSLPPKTPHSARSSTSSATLISPQTAQAPDVTPKTRRRLAVEGLRKAASDAALRKIGLNVCPGWSRNTVELGAPEVKEVAENVTTTPASQHIMDSPSHEAFQNAPESLSYLPRQYGPKPLLLPSKLARSNSFRSPNDSMRQRTNSHQSSFSLTHSPQRRIHFEERPKSDFELVAALETNSSPKSKMILSQCPTDSPDTFKNVQEKTRFREFGYPCRSPHSLERVEEQPNSSEVDESFISAQPGENTEGEIKSNAVEEFDISDENNSTFERTETTDYSQEAITPKLGDISQKDCDSPRPEENSGTQKIIRAAFRWAMDSKPTMRSGVMRRPTADDTRPHSFGGWLTSEWPQGFDQIKELRPPSISIGSEPKSPTQENCSKSSQKKPEFVLEDNFVARAEFVLPTQATRTDVWKNLRDISSPPVTWKSWIATQVSSMKDDLKFPQIT